MDRKSIIGLIIIGIMFFAFAIFNQPSNEEIKQKQEVEKKDEIASPQKNILEKPTIQQKLIDSGAIETINVLENEKLKIEFTNFGAIPKKVEFKEYKTYEKKSLILYKENDLSLYLQFFSKNTVVNTSTFAFQVKEKKLSNGKSLIFKKNIEEGTLEYVYTLLNGSYKIDFKVNFINFKNLIPKNNNTIYFNWEQKINKVEKSKEWEDRYTALYYKYVGDEVDYLSTTSDEKEDLATPLKWVAYKQLFFSSIFVAKTKFTSAEVDSHKSSEADTTYLKNLKSVMTMPYDENSSKLEFEYYLLPNKYKVLKAENQDFNKLLDFGWKLFSWISVYCVIPVFNFLENYISNYGIIILLLTLIIKLVLFPLTFKSFISQARMRVLKPQVEEINAKIPADRAMERQQEMMKMYKKAGVNPLSGCIPILLQFPILYAMFMFFPSAMELRGQPFLWAEDLSSYDSVLQLPFTIPFYGSHVSLFCLLMTVTNVFYTVQNSKQMDTGGTQFAGMKYMMYMMPVFFMFLLNSYSSGLSYYYFISTLITILQTYAIKAMIDEKKILAKLHDNQKKPQKKSRFQLALEEAQKKQMSKMKKK